MSNQYMFGLPLQEYPSTILLSGKDAANVDWTMVRDIRRLDQVQLEACTHIDAALRELASFPTLENVFLDDSDVTVEGLRQFSKSPASMSLSVAGTKLTRECFGAFSEIQGIERLNLSKCEFDSAWLSVLHRHPKLAVLDLRDTQIGDSDLEILSEFTRRELLILDDSRMTEQGVTALRRRLPGVRVHWNGSE